MEVLHQGSSVTGKLGQIDLFLFFEEKWVEVTCAPADRRLGNLHAGKSNGLPIRLFAHR